MSCLLENSIDLTIIKWICAGAAGVTLIIVYNNWYAKKMENVFDRELAIRSSKYLEKFGLGYASSLADCYFHGYLEIIVDGLVGRIKEYKKTFPPNYVMPCKIFLIAHKSGYSPNNYEDELPSRFESRRKIEYEVEGRNGIRKRLYQSSVYKIKELDNASEHISVLMEGAPGLRHLYESSLKNPHLKELYDPIVSTFVKKMNEKIESSVPCRGLFEVVYFDDDVDAACKGIRAYHWLASEILRRVRLNLH